MYITMVFILIKLLLTYFPRDASKICSLLQKNDMFENLYLYFNLTHILKGLKFKNWGDFNNFYINYCITH